MRHKLTHPHTHAPFLFHLPPPLPCQRHSQRLFLGNIFHPEGNVCAPTFIVSCKAAGIRRLNPTKPPYPPLLRNCLYCCNRLSTCGSKRRLSSHHSFMGKSNVTRHWKRICEQVNKMIIIQAGGLTCFLCWKGSCDMSIVTTIILFCFFYLFKKSSENVGNGYNKWE